MNQIIRLDRIISSERMNIGSQRNRTKLIDGVRSSARRGLRCTELETHDISSLVRHSTDEQRTLTTRKDN